MRRGTGRVLHIATPAEMIVGRFPCNSTAELGTMIANRGDEIPLEFRLAGIAPESWTAADSLAVLFYMSWTTAANLNDEVIAQLLVDKVGLARARE